MPTVGTKVETKTHDKIRRVVFMQSRKIHRKAIDGIAKNSFQKAWLGEGGVTKCSKERFHQGRPTI